MSTLITDPKALPALVDQARDSFAVMGYMLEFYTDLSDAEIDALVEAVAAPIRAAIDCTQCANCCQSLQVHVTREDVAIMSAGLHISPADIETRYLTDEGCAPIHEWKKFTPQPCPMLKDKRCSIYPHRPETCRSYPTLNDFRWLIDNYIDGAAICPIIYNTLTQMVVKVDEIR